MSDPVTLTAAGITALFLTEAIKKSGASIGEALAVQLDRLSELLRTRFKQLFEKLKQLPPCEAEIVLDAEIVEEVEAAMQRDPEVAQAVEVIARTVREQKVLTDGEFGSLKVGNITVNPQKGLESQQVVTNLKVVEHAEIGDITVEG